MLIYKSLGVKFLELKNHFTSILFSKNFILLAARRFNI